MSYDLVGLGVAPNIYIKCIELSEGHQPLRDDNPHVDRNSETIETSLRSGRTFRQSVPRDKKHLIKRSKDSKNLIIKVNLSLYDFMDNNDHTSWYNNDFVKKYIKIRLICTQNTRFVDDVRNGSIMIDSSVYSKYTKERSDDIVEKIIPLETSRALSDNMKMASDEYDEQYCVDYYGEFVVKNLRPEFLVVMAHCFIDTDEMFQDYNMMLGQDFDHSAGPLSLEQVIVNTRVVRRNKVMKLPDGRIYVGPTHNHPDSGLMVGAYHTTNQHPTLTIEEVENSKIRDLRDIDIVFKRIQTLIKQKVDLVDPLRTREDYLTENKNILPIERNYLTDIFLTADQNNFVRYTFGFDLQNYIFENSKYKNLLKDLSFNHKKEIIDNFKILDVILERKRVRKSILANSVNTEYLGNRDWTVPFNYELADYLNKGREFDQNPVPVTEVSFDNNYPSHTDGINPTDFNGTMGPLALNNFDDPIKFFQGVDMKVGKKFGHHQYKVKIKILDNTKKYFASRAKDLESTIKSFENMFVIYNQKQSKEFYRNREYKNSRFNDPVIVPYVNPITDMVEEKFSTQFLRKLKFKMVTGENFTNGIATFLDCLAMITNLKKAEVTHYTRVFTHLLMPHKTTGAIINKIIELMKFVYKKYIDIFELKDKSHSLGSRRKNKNKEVILEIEEEFSNTIDMSNNYESYHADFFDKPNSSFTGPIKITNKDFLNRMSFERSKYFTGNPLSKFNPDLSKYRSLYDISKNSFSYITPIKLSYGVSSINFNIQPELMWNPDHFNDMMMSYHNNKFYRKNILLNDKSRANIASNFIGRYGVTIEKELPNIPLIPLEFETGYTTLIESQEFLGQSSDFLTPEDQIIECLEEQVDEEKNKLINVSAPIFLNFAITNPNFVSRQRLANLSFKNNTQMRRIRKIDSVSYFDIDSDHCFINSMINNKRGRTSRPQRTRSRYGPTSDHRVGRLPMHLKSIFLGRTGVTKINWFDKDYDFLKKPEFKSMGIFHYKTIYQLEYLSGFKNSADGRIMLKQPEWKLLDNDIYNSLQNRTTLVRLRPYKNDMFNTYQGDLVGMEPINTLFVLNHSDPASNQTRLRIPKNKRRLAQTVESLVQRENPLKSIFSVSDIPGQNPFLVSKIIDRVPLNRTSLFRGKLPSSKFRKPVLKSSIFNPGPKSTPQMDPFRINGLFVNFPPVEPNNVEPRVDPMATSPSMKNSYAKRVESPMARNITAKVSSPTSIAKPSAGRSGGGGGGGDGGGGDGGGGMSGGGGGGY